MSEESKRPAIIHNPPLSRDRLVFSHPSEEELARILDFYGIKWRYEPTTFPLQWDEDGNLLEAFSPDFYLVDEDLYVELTTLRPRLMRLKHQKIRRLQGLYPEINIRLWNRADFVHLLERFGVTERSADLVGKEALENRDATDG